MSTSTSSARRRQPYHHGSLRAALLAEAVRVLAEADAATLSLRDLARRLGVSHAAPYRHFADKDALLAAIAHQGFELLTAELETAAAPHPEEPLRQLADTGWAYVRFALRQPQHFQLMFGWSAVPQTIYPDVRAAGQGAFDVLLRIIENGQQVGQVVEAHPRAVAMAAWSQVHGLATLLLEGQVPHLDETECEVLVRRTLQIQQTGLAR